MKICQHCKQEFSEDVIGRVFSNHVRWCDKNPNRNKTDNLKKASQKFLDATQGKLMTFGVSCNKCNKSITVMEREFKFPSREKYYCGKSCSQSRIRTQVVKDKISQTLLDKINSGELIVFGGHKAEYETRICPECNGSFQVNKIVSKTFCSVSCVRKNKKTSDEFLAYKHACAFKFNVWQYPEEFNLDLIKEHGWYKAANRGNNLTGVSRDHKISVMFGWENKIPPEIIAHPANCELMQHAKNISKHAGCSILLEQLLDTINIWNAKYKLELQ